jgi:hypothetical protein
MLTPELENKYKKYIKDLYDSGLYDTYEQCKNLYKLLFGKVFDLQLDKNDLSKEEINDMKDKKFDKNYEHKFYKDLYDGIYGDGYYEKNFNDNLKKHKDNCHCNCHKKEKDNFYTDDDTYLIGKCHCHTDPKNDNEYGEDYGDSYDDINNDVIHDYDDKLEDFHGWSNENDDILLKDNDFEFNKSSREMFVHEILCLMKSIILAKTENKLNVTFYKKDHQNKYSPSAFEYKFKIERNSNDDYDLFIKAKNYVNGMFDYIFNKELDFSLSIEDNSAEFDILSYI